MRISIEVGHPAHVHYWRNVIRILLERGHNVDILAREKELTLSLLDAYHLPYLKVGFSRPTMVWKALGVPRDDIRVLRIAKRLRTELMLSTGIPASAQASRVLGIPHISLIDTEIASVGRLLAEPFSDAVCTPACFKSPVDPSKHIKFNGYLELMYLRPNYFQPDKTVLEGLGIASGEKYAVVRFSSWDSSHDLGYGEGIIQSANAKAALIDDLQGRYRVFISSETQLQRELEPFRLNLPPERFHDLLAFASIYVGEGATAASEAGVLGIPWIYISNSPRGYLEDQEKRFGLGKTVTSVAEILPLLDTWAPDIESGRWSHRRTRLLEETIDVTKFMADLIDGWPESRKALTEGS